MTNMVNRELKVAWLFPNILYLHGERGNIKALKRIAAFADIEVAVEKVSYDYEGFDPNNFDIIFCAPGEIVMFPAVVNWLKPYKAKFEEFIEKGKVLLVTGTSQAIFGKETKREDGQVVEGDVVRITDFGAFVDIGGMDGLLPLSQMSWRWVDHPSDVLKINDKIKVEIIGIDHDKQRVSLSLKNLEADPWIEAKSKIKENDKVEGTITRIKHFGAFVEVFPGVEALLPNNEVVDYQNKNNCILATGDKIQTTIIKFNPDDRRISLSIEAD